jgi:hypothetical protein
MEIHSPRMISMVAVIEGKTHIKYDLNSPISRSQGLDIIAEKLGTNYRGQWQLNEGGFYSCALGSKAKLYPVREYLVATKNTKGSADPNSTDVADYWSIWVLMNGDSIKLEDKEPEIKEALAE